jgi:hypothetical protein
MEEPYLLRRLKKEKLILYMFSNIVTLRIPQRSICNFTVNYTDREWIYKSIKLHSKLSNFKPSKGKLFIYEDIKNHITKDEMNVDKYEKKFK